MEEMASQHLSPFLVRSEVLYLLGLVLVLSVAWLLWEIFSFAGADADVSGDWWEALRHCNHRRLIIPVRAR
jgi:hypothetical protein